MGARIKPILRGLEQMTWAAERWVGWVLEPAPAYDLVSRRITSFEGFGGWTAFKAADIFERVLGVPIDFTNAPLSSHPREGARLIGGDIPTATAMLMEGLADLKAPPDYRRPIGIQEIETICCKWLEFSSGKYYVGKDIDQERRMLAEVPCDLSRQLGAVLDGSFQQTSRNGDQRRKPEQLDLFGRTAK